MKKFDHEEMIGCTYELDEGDLVGIDYESIEDINDKCAVLMAKGKILFVPKSQIYDASKKLIEVTKFWASRNVF